MGLYNFHFSFVLVNAETFISITDVLDCDSTEASQLFSSLVMLVKNCLYEGLGDRQSIASIFPGEFFFAQI